VAVVGVDTKLVDHLKGVFASVLNVAQGVVQRRAIIAGEAVVLVDGAGGDEDLGGDDFLQKTRELAIGETDAVAGRELFAEIFLQRGAVANVLPVVLF